MIKKLFIVVLPFGLLFLLCGGIVKQNGIAGRTGSPGETNCRSCHSDFALNSGGGSITIQSPGMTGFQYTPGQTYSMSVTVAQSGLGLFGTGIEALNSSNTNAGTLSNVNSTLHLLTAANARTNLVHSTNGGASANSMVFSFSWLAPAAGTGNVTFYFAGVAANGNNNDGGDWVYTSNQVFTEAPCTAPSQPGTISGNATVCSGDAVTYSIAAVTGATSYTWTLPSGWIGTSTSTSISPTAGSTSGNITVKANNACGSSTVTSFAVVVDNLNVAVTPVAANCNGGTGSATATPSNGTIPFTYAWSPSGGNAATAINLTAGNYSVLVTDGNGCRKTTSTTISEPTAIAATVSQLNNLCFGDSTGVATVNASGGSGALSYVWTPGGMTTSTIINKTAGTYGVTITDSHGCTKTASVTLTQPQPININPSITGIQCFGTNTGFIHLSVSGGTGSYNYNWNTGALHDTLNNLFAGIYSAIVTDGNGCKDSIVNVVSNLNPAISTSVSVTPSSCNLSNGSAFASASGGAGTLHYSWNSIPVQNNDTATNLNSGSYILSVTDSFGCLDTTHVTIGQNTSLSSVSNAVDLKCFGDSNGIASVSPTGGVQPYSYLWNTTPTDTTDSISNLIAGNYSVVITDQSGCSITINVPVVQPPILIASAGSDQSICSGESILIGDSPSVSGGSGSYDFNWLPNSQLSSSIDPNPLAFPLNTTTYVLTVTDSNGCTASSSTVVDVNQLPTATISVNGDTLYSSSGNQFQWLLNGNPIPGAIDSIWIPQVNGNYFVIVTNSFGCSDTSLAQLVTTVFVDSPKNKILLNIIPNPASDFIQIINPGNAIASFTLYDLTGKIIIQKIISERDTILSIQEFKKGIYSAVIKSGDEILTKKLIFK